MNILLSNDDGIAAGGLKALAAALSKAHTVFVAASDSERSGSGHGIAFKESLRFEKTELAGAAAAFTVYGSPADCVKFFLNRLQTEAIDLVVSGINHGKNTGTDVVYSGTVAAAVEAAINGVNGLAVSYSGAAYDFERAAAFVAGNLAALTERTLGRPSLSSVNFPPCPFGTIKGVRVTPLGEQRYDDEYLAGEEGGTTAYRLKMNSYIEADNPRNCDVVLSAEGYITVTPLHYDLTDRKVLRLMKNRRFTI